MSKVDDIKKITRKFVDENKQFRCKYNGCHCNRNKKEESCVGPFWGDEKSNVLIIAESPSGKGNHFGKYFGDSELDKVQKGLRDFIYDKFDKKVPFFTDVVKCGVSARKKLKTKELDKRFEKCKKYLKKEIESIKPVVIICIGKYAEDKIRKNVRNQDFLFKKLNKRPEVYKLIHYSTEGKITFATKEKKEIIWPIELAMQQNKELTNIDKDISKLDYFRNNYGQNK